MIELNIWLGSPLKHIKKNLALFLYTESKIAYTQGCTKLIKFYT